MATPSVRPACGPYESDLDHPPEDPPGKGAEACGQKVRKGRPDSRITPDLSGQPDDYAQSPLEALEWPKKGALSRGGRFRGGEDGLDVDLGAHYTAYHRKSCPKPLPDPARRG